MSNTKPVFLIFGSKGWIGGKVCKLLKEMGYTYYESECRADNFNDVEEDILSKHNLTHVMSFIGRTHGTYEGQKIGTIDYLEKPGKLVENIRDNLYSPLVLSELSKKFELHFTYLGTGCIFDYDNDKHLFGDEGTGFNEYDEPNFYGSSYSIVKGFSDRIFHLGLSDHVLNARIRMPITDEFNERNFITKITNYENVCSIPNSMSVLNELLPILISMAVNKRVGTINLTNPGLISHNEILTMYKEIVDTTFEWKNFSIEEQNTILASKRSNNCLDTQILEYHCKVLNLKLSPIKEAVRDVLFKMKENKEEKISYKKQPILNDKQPSKDYNIKNLLVTGGCGFIGSNFINYFYEKHPEINIVNLDAMYYCASEENINTHIRKSDRYHLVKGNLCSFDLVRHILEEYKIDTVIHFAAQSHVQNSFEDSLQYTNDNVLGTHTLLETCRRYGKIKRFIHISTDEVYGESMLEENEEKKHEESILCPTNPYAATKAAAELIAKSYYHSFKMPIIITRGNNVYGPNQYPEKLIPRFIELLKNDKPVTIQGDGSNVRAFLHVNDVCSALELVLKNGEIGEIYNIGSDENQEYTVKEIANILINKIKGCHSINGWDPEKIKNHIIYIKDRPFNDKRYYISNEKVKNLGWEIKVDFDEGLNQLIRKIFNY